MARYNTSLGRSVPHCHIPEIPYCQPSEMNAAAIQEARDWLSRNFPKAVEIHPPSWKYNCHGYAYAQAQGWFNDPQMFLEDDFYDVPLNKARIGDVVIYMNGEDLGHSAIVKEVKNGRIKKVRSKWGPYAAVVHKPEYVDDKFGVPVRLVRRRKLSRGHGGMQTR